MTKFNGENVKYNHLTITTRKPRIYYNYYYCGDSVNLNKK